MKILGIESSCDETGVAIYCAEGGLLAHEIYSQVKDHAKFGGVVPELASRDHIRKTLPLIKKTLTVARLDLADLGGIAYTMGPGLAGALLVGASLGRALAFALNIPAIGIHHLEAHLLAPLLSQQKPALPFLALLVSGGHTQLIEVKALGDYQLLATTLDDAVGEAFDKTAKLLGLPYPGGAALAELALAGDPQAFQFARPMIQKAGLNFSFSGLKTQVMQTVKFLGQITQQQKADVAASFETAVVETLVLKCRRALKQTNLKRLVVAGGVAANKNLRKQLTNLLSNLNGEVYFPELEFCTDNGAMIAYTGFLRLSAGQRDGLQIQVKPRWSLSDLKPIQ